MPPEKSIANKPAQIKKLKKEDGFTLIEILIALSIFAVGLLALAAMQTSAIEMNSTAGKLTNLSTLGMDKIEELSALPYSDPLVDPAGNPHQEVMGDYTVTWTVVDDNPMPSTKSIMVTVTGRGKTAVISFIMPNV